MTLIGVRLPIPWSGLGFTTPWLAGATVVDDGRVAWAWDSAVPDFGVAGVDPGEAAAVEGWDLDHVVLLVPSMDEAVAELRAVGADLRMRMEVRGRPTSFFRVGTILEVIEVGVPVPGLYGVALRTTEALEEVADRWREMGHDVSEPRDAIQPDRRILTVKGLDAGLAVMDWPAQSAASTS